MLVRERDEQTGRGCGGAQVGAVVAERCKYMDSKKLPLWLEFQPAHAPQRASEAGATPATVSPIRGQGHG